MPVYQLIIGGEHGGQRDEEFVVWVTHNPCLANAMAHAWILEPTDAVPVADVIEAIEDHYDADCEILRVLRAIDPDRVAWTNLHLANQPTR